MSSSDVGFSQPITSKNDVTLCKLDVDVKNRKAIAGSVGFLNLSRNSLMEKSATLKIKCGKLKVCKKKYLSWVYGVDRTNPSLGITVLHHSASLVMPISDRRDRFFYPHHTPMKDTHNLSLASSFLLAI